MLKRIGMIALLFSSSAHAQVMWTACGDNNPGYAGNGMVVYIKVNPQAMQSLSNPATVLDLLAKYQGGIREMMIQKCTGTKITDNSSGVTKLKILNPAGSSIKAMLGPQSPQAWVTAMWDPRSNQWQLDTRGLQQAMAEETRQQAAAVQQQQSQKVLEDKKAAAISACGADPSLSGGPWFSSTYKIAAQDAVRLVIQYPSNNYICVKTVEYLSAAESSTSASIARTSFVAISTSVISTPLILRHALDAPHKGGPDLSCDRKLACSPTSPRSYQVGKHRPISRDRGGRRLEYS
jgi:hypothetical protein